ncbi:MAG: 1,4-alpha-glucan branching protein domain-containing protein, partial [Tepidiformaceae bacterium]
LVASELYMYENGAGEPGTLLSAYDTELFGHWWLEGVQWLEWTIRGLAANPDVQLVSAGDNIAQDPPAASIELPEGSWGAGGDHRTWVNEETAWTWPEIYRRQDRARPLLAAVTPSTQQLARELLLLQSSDWQFLMTTGQAHDYAIERFNSHAGRFDELASAIETNSPGLKALTTEYASLDNPFPQINPLIYSVHRPAVQSRL